ncbi:MAG: NAD(P)H-dependent oxidoreductase [Bacteroidales bacterium]|nr:NAD(P)H-dependent oxidoreductase [Bacteroidales bacterium]
MKLKVAIIYGSVRSDRQGIKLVKFLSNQLKNKGIESQIIDPMEFQLPMIDKMYKEYTKGEAPLAMQMIHDILIDVDGYVIVSGEYNHSIPPALSNLLDHFQSEYYFKPAALAVYSAGGFGGARVLPQLRTIVGELGMVSTSSVFYVARVQDAFHEDGNDKTGEFESRSKTFINEFEWYLKTMKEGSKFEKPY